MGMIKHELECACRRRAELWYLCKPAPKQSTLCWYSDDAKTVNSTAVTPYRPTMRQSFVLSSTSTDTFARFCSWKTSATELKH